MLRKFITVILGAGALTLATAGTALAQPVPPATQNITAQAEVSEFITLSGFNTTTIDFGAVVPGSNVSNSSESYNLQTTDPAGFR